jgi:hypothetical protein
MATLFIGVLDQDFAFSSERQGELLVVYITVYHATVAHMYLWVHIYSLGAKTVSTYIRQHSHPSRYEAAGEPFMYRKRSASLAKSSAGITTAMPPTDTVDGNESETENYVNMPFQQRCTEVGLFASIVEKNLRDF